MLLHRLTAAATTRGVLQAPDTAQTSTNVVLKSQAAALAPQVALDWRLFPATQFSNHMEAWQALSEAKNSPVLEPAFINAALSEFACGNELLAICGDERSPVAMCILRRVGPCSWQTFQPSQVPLGLWIHRSGYSWQQLMAGLMEKLPGIPLVLGVSQKSIKNYPRPDDNDCIRTLDFVETTRILVNQSFDSYWNSRDDNTKRQIKRRLRRLNDDGIEPRLEAITDPAAMREAVAEFGRIESAGWKGLLGTAIHIDNGQGNFYSRILSEFCARGSGVVYRYSFNDVTVAMELCVRGADSMVMLKTTYDESYAKYAPGMLMRYAIFERIFADRSIKKIEFLGKLQPWQLKWCTETYQLYHINRYRFEILAKYDAIRRAWQARKLTAQANDRIQVAEKNKDAGQVAELAIRRYDDLNPPSRKAQVRQIRARTIFNQVAPKMSRERSAASVGSSCRSQVALH